MKKNSSTVSIRESLLATIRMGLIGLSLVSVVGIGGQSFAATKEYSVPIPDLTAELIKPKAAYPHRHWDFGDRTHYFNMPLFDGALGTLTHVEMKWTLEYLVSDTTELTDTTRRETRNSTGTRYTSVLDGWFHTDTFNTIRVDVFSITKNGTTSRSTAGRSYYADFYEVKNDKLHRADVPNKVVVNSFQNPQSTYAFVNGEQNKGWTSAQYSCGKATGPNIYSKCAGRDFQCKNQYGYSVGGPRLRDASTYPNAETGKQNEGLTLCSRSFYPIDGESKNLNQTFFPGGKLTSRRSSPSGTRANRAWGPVQPSDFVCPAGGSCKMTIRAQNYLQSSIWCSTENESGGQDTCEQKAVSEIRDAFLTVTYTYTPFSSVVSTSNLSATDQNQPAQDACQGIPGCRTHASAPYQIMPRQSADGVEEQILARGFPDDLYYPAMLEETFNVVVTPENGDPEPQCWAFYDDKTMTVTNLDEETITLAVIESNRRGNRGNFNAVTNDMPDDFTIYSIFAERSDVNLKGETIERHTLNDTMENSTFRGKKIAETCDLWLDYN